MPQHISVIKSDSFGDISELERPQTTRCCCASNSHKIAPSPGIYNDYEIVEVRKNRKLRIQRLTVESEERQYVKQSSKSTTTLTRGRNITTPISAGTCDHNFFNEENNFNENYRKISIDRRTSHAESSARIKSASKQFRVTSGSALSRHQNGHNHSTNYNAAAERQCCTGEGSAGNDMISKRQAKSFSKQHGSSSCDESVLEQSSHGHTFDIKVDSIPSEAIFFIHGVGGSGDVWRMQAEFFKSRGYSVIIPDLIGHGFSSSPKESQSYQFEEIKKDILAIFDHHRKDSNIIIGHSYGASFATVVARERARWVQHLVLLSGGSPTPLAPQRGLFSLPTCTLQCCMPFMRRAFKRSAFHNENASMKWCDCAFDVPTWVLRHVMNGQVWPEGGTEYHEWITSPTLIIHGQHDQLISLEEEKHMQATIPNCHLVVIDGASHMVMVECPVEVNTLISSFITFKQKKTHCEDASQSDNCDLTHGTTSVDSSQDYVDR